MASQSSSNLAVSWEDVLWDECWQSQVSHSGQSWVARPYRAAVPARLAEARWQVSSEVAAETEEAAVAMARFESRVMAQFAPYAVVLLWGEAWLSSQIEGVSASARKVAEAALTQPADFGVRTSNAELIVANVRAMDAALQLAERVDQAAILSMHRALLQGSAPDIAGKWRDDQVWIGGHSRLSALSPHTADFVPPTHLRVPEAVADLVHFAERQDLPALAQTAITHAQCETIHPFADGNGRTGRALIHAMLRAKGLTNHVSVPLSSGLLTARDNYFEALTHYRDGEIDPIASEVARAALVGVARGRALVADLGQARDQWRESLAKVRAHSAVHQLADLLMTQPVVTSRLVAEKLDTKNPDRLLKTLAEHGIIVSASHHKSRTRLWRAPDVLDALDRFAEMAGRRY